MASYSLARIQPASEVLDDSKYQYIFSVEEVNKLVLEGMSFREAYKAVARQIQEGTYHPDPSVHHTHEGSIGNLCNEKITVKLETLKRLFRFEQKDKACHGLLTL
jgi:argininosuccinate lyase